MALTRVQKLCIIMGFLDMRGLLGAATVIGCLKYGAGVCRVHADNPSAEVFLKERSLNAGPDDSTFLTSLRWSLNTPRGTYPPVLWRKFTAKNKHPLTKIRRLHLIVVDLEKTRSVSKRVYQDFKDCPASWGPSVVEAIQNVMRLGLLRSQSSVTLRCSIVQKLPWALRPVS